MIKKVLLSALVLILVTIAALVGYLFHIHESRPSGVPLVTTVITDDHYREASRAASALILALYEQHQIPSISATVGMDGKLLWQGVVGYADYAKEVPAGVNTQYRIGSISKSMTAVAALRLQEKAMLDIDQLFSHYVKDFPATHDRITLKHLLSHHAGIRHYLNEIAENFNSREYETPRAAAAIVERDALLFPPGQGFHYSTYGYTLLSLAMERAAEKSFKQLMIDELFEPLGLRSTHFNNLEQSNNLARSTPYLEFDGALYRSPEPNVSNKYAGGGFLSTPTDLVIFGNALLDNSALSDASLDVLWSKVALENGEANPEHYALGFRVGDDELGRFVHHGGKSVGGYTFLVIYPDHKMTVAFAVNSTPSDSAFDRLTEAQNIARLFAPH